MPQILIRIAFIVALPLALVQTARAAESYENCSGFVDSIPATITTQGVWCLRADLSTAITNGTAITIATNNVTLDCNDFKLGGLAGGINTETVGVSAAGRQNAVVRRCNIRGFYTGVQLSGGGGHIVENSRFDGNTWIGIRISAANSLVRGNQVLDTGNSSLQTNYYAIAVESGEAIDILDNAVSGVSSNQANYSTFGIWIGTARGALVRGNRVRELQAAGTGTAYGLLALAPFGFAFEGNFVHGNAVAGSVEIQCGSNAGSAVRNTVRGFATGIQTCTQSQNLVNVN